MVLGEWASEFEYCADCHLQMDQGCSEEASPTQLLHAVIGCCTLITQTRGKKKEKKGTKKSRLLPNASFTKGHFALLMRSVPWWRCPITEGFPTPVIFADLIIRCQWCYHPTPRQTYSHQSVTVKIAWPPKCGVIVPMGLLHGVLIAAPPPTVLKQQTRWWSPSDWISAPQKSDPFLFLHCLPSTRRRISI